MTVHGAIGVVRRDGKVLIALRPAGKHLAGYWEFPGGRVEEGETAEQAVVREMREETGIDIRVSARGEAIDWDYGDKQVHLDVFLCDWVKGEPRPIGCDAVKWVEVRELAHHRFPAANDSLIQALLLTSTSANPSDRAPVPRP